MSPTLLDNVVADPGDHTIDELLAAHAEQLGDVIQMVGRAQAAEAARVSPATLAAVADGDVAATGDLDLEAAAAVLALADESPPDDEIVAAAREALLFGMTTGVLNVDVVAGEVSLDLEPREIQGMLEGRHPMTLREYASLQRVIADRTP